MPENFGAATSSFASTSSAVAAFADRPSAKQYKENRNWRILLYTRQLRVWSRPCTLSLPAHFQRWVPAAEQIRAYRSVTSASVPQRNLFAAPGLLVAILVPPKI